jgi:undecaprenyl-diphosphatase
VHTVTAQPGRIYRLFTGAALSQLLLTAALVLCVHALGGHVNFGGVVLVVAFTSVIGTLAPVPAGMGVMEASSIVGLTLFGVPQDVAIAATLLFRSCTTYLPALWGWRAFEGLRLRTDD